MMSMQVFQLEFPEMANIIIDISVSLTNAEMKWKCKQLIKLIRNTLISSISCLHRFCEMLLI